MKRRRIFFHRFALWCSGFAAFCLLWTLIPPPLALLWLLAVGASEWSLWFGALGLVGAVMGIVCLRRPAPQKTGAFLAVGLGAAAAGVSLLPLLRTLPVARANHVPLSPTRYLFGEVFSVADPVRCETQTYRVAGGQTLRADIYRGQDEIHDDTTPRPAVIVVHGGSWQGGRRSDFAHWDRWLALQGYIVFDIDYRLRPQPNWHEADGDVRASVAWVRRNASRYQVNPHRIALMGRSAGGQLALLAAYTTVPSVQVAVSLYGPTDLAWGYTHPAVPDVINGPKVLRNFLGGTPNTLPTMYREASPIYHVGPKTPPTLLLHGEQDLLVGPQHTRLLSAALSSAGVPYQAVYFPYALHGYDFHFDGWGGQVTQVVLLRFLHKHL